jgi:glycosyltransferase involved in cell wall biosynthesis
MSAGCAIVGSNTPPVREVLKHGDTGLLVDFFDHEMLAKSVALLLEDRSLASRLGAAARQHAVRQYDLRTVCLPSQLAWVDDLLQFASAQQ